MGFPAFRLHAPTCTLLCYILITTQTDSSPFQRPRPGCTIYQVFHTALQQSSVRFAHITTVSYIPLRPVI